MLDWLLNMGLIVLGCEITWSWRCRISFRIPSCIGVGGCDLLAHEMMALTQSFRSVACLDIIIEA